LQTRRLISVMKQPQICKSETKEILLKQKSYGWRDKVAHTKIFFSTGNITVFAFFEISNAYFAKDVKLLTCRLKRMLYCGSIPEEAEDEFE